MTHDPRLEDLRRTMRGRRTDDVGDEIRFHLEGVEEELRSAGFTVTEAREAARARFGNIEHVAHEMRALDSQRRRSMTRIEWIRAAARDVKYAWRTLRRAPAFSIAVLVTWALGIGATMAIFTVAYAIWLKPLPYSDPNNLVTITDTYRGSGGGGVSAPEIADFRANRALEDIAAFSYGASITAIHDEPVRIVAYRVTPNAFSVLGVRAVRGRTFDSTDVGDGENPVVLSDAFWRTHLAADPNVVGRQLNLFGTPATIIGVMPAQFRFPQVLPSDVWVPLDLNKVEPNRNARYLQAIARLRPGYTITSAAATMAAIGSRLSALHPESNAGWSMSLTSLVDETLGAYRTAFSLLLGIVAALLAIVCANIAALFLARNMARHGELTVRAALGASRTRLALHVTAESVLLSVAGGALGLGLAALGALALASMLPSMTPRLASVGLNGPIALFAFALSVVTGLLCGLAPALRASLVAPASTLQAAGRTITTRYRLQNTLVVFEVAISVTLLVTATAILLSFVKLIKRDPGFVASDLLTMHVTLPFDRYQVPSERARLLEDILTRVRALPGVREAGAVTGYPGSHMGILGYGPVSPTASPSQTPVQSTVRAADPAYLKTMGTPLIAGRFFSSDDGLASVPVAIINRTLARSLWPGEDAVGRSLALPASMEGMGAPKLVTVVGVADDMRLGATASPELFIPWSQLPVFWADVVVRTSGDPVRYTGAVRRQLTALDRQLLVEEIAPMTEIMGDFVALQRSQTVIAASLGALATLLSAVGIFGLLSYIVGQRRREIGVRLALGASSQNVFGVILGRGLVLTVLGIVCGSVAAQGLVAVLRARVFGLTGAGPGVFAAAAGLMLAVALLAALVPSWRAARVDPLASMR
ncbi:MAG: ABC transporter permease [Gemmatimonadaceae bacterium]